MTNVLIKSLIPVISALAGTLFVFAIKLDHKRLCALISFSAGALFSAAAFTLLPESSEYIPVLELLISLASGYLLFFFISKYFAHVCPACSASHFDAQTTKKFTEIVWTLLTALSIHSFLDGLAVTTGTGNSHHESVFAAITTHKFPEGLALAALMASAGYKHSKIFLYVFLVELVTVVGALSGYFFFEETFSPEIMGIVMSHISGGFIYLSFHAVLGEMLKNHKGLVITSFAAGLLLILSVHVILG
jgi:zinc and cadmium transporter